MDIGSTATSVLKGFEENIMHLINKFIVISFMNLLILIT